MSENSAETPALERVVWHLAVTVITVIPIFWLIYQNIGVVEAVLEAWGLSVIAVTAAAAIVALVLPVVTYPFFKDVLRSLAGRERRERREDR
jgi:membrane protein YdbS with pleckstrin-like domain